MVSRDEYRRIQERILELMHECGSSIDPPDLLARLRQEEGISQELGSAIMWEMIRAGYISRSDDWRLSPKKELKQEARVYA